MIYSINGTYLCHSGIKGMKWGIRRYQNEDGTLTSAGRARYKIASSNERKTLENLNRIKNDKKRMSRMSDRQKQRLYRDIDHYTKRLTGEVKKKNIISRNEDLKRSKSAGNRFKESVLNYAALSSLQTIAVNKISDEKFKPSQAASIAFNSVLNAGSTLAVSEIYNKAVGRY